MKIITVVSDDRETLEAIKTLAEKLGVPVKMDEVESLDQVNEKVKEHEG